jgi:hypothetical protein
MDINRLRSMRHGVWISILTGVEVEQMENGNSWIIFASVIQKLSENHVMSFPELKN